MLLKIQKKSTNSDKIQRSVATSRPIAIGIVARFVAYLLTAYIVWWAVVPVRGQST